MIVYIMTFDEKNDVILTVDKINRQKTRQNDLHYIGR